MKKLLFVLVFPLLLFSCGEKENPCLKLEEDNASLREAISAREKDFEELTNTMDVVEASLGGINASQKTIDSAKAASGSVEDRKNRIKEALLKIEEERAKSKETVAALEKKLRKSGSNSKSLQKIIDKLKAQIEAKEAQIDSLQNTVTSLVGDIENLKATVASKDEALAKKESELADRQRALEEKDTELHTAYYTIGTRKDLVTAGILKAEGGVLGMGKTTKLSEKLDKSKFTAINIKTANEVEIGAAKKYKVITSHPAESYTIINSEGKIRLQITDYAKFWSLSKFLVVELN